MFGCAQTNLYSKCSKIINAFLFLFSNKMLDIRSAIHKILVGIANREIQIRLLLQKQSDLSLNCLSMPFWQATMFKILENSPYLQ